jgi:hypothetical protein
MQVVAEDTKASPQMHSVSQAPEQDAAPRAVARQFWAHEERDDMSGHEPLPEPEPEPEPLPEPEPDPEPEPLPLPPPAEQVEDWRARTAEASEGHLETMHMVAEETNESPQMHSVSHAPEHEASPRAVARQP